MKGLKLKNNSALQNLIHEYVHWKIVKDTSLASIVDGISWRLRFDQLCLCEMIHQKTNLPRLLNHENDEILQQNKEEFRRKINLLENDYTMKQIFHDLITCHYYTLFYYQTILAIIVEPVTWALVEPEWMKEKEKYLEAYFGELDSPTHEMASRILSKCELFLNSKNSREARRTLIKAANNALDMPMAKENLVDGTLEKLQSMIETIIGRFENVLDGKQISLAIQKEKTFGNVLSYGLWITEDHNVINKTVVEILSNIANREPELFGYMIDRMRMWLNQPAYAYPTILFNCMITKDKFVKLRYDQLTGLTSSEETSSPIGNRKVRLTGMPLNRIDDIVGDLPSLLSTSLQVLYYLGVDDKEHCLELGKNLQHVDKENHGEKYYEQYKSFVNKLFENKPDNLTYDSLRNGNNFGAFLQFWLEMQINIGPGTKYLFMEHGMGA